MAGLEEIRVGSREGEVEDPAYPTGRELSTSPRKNKRRSRKRRNSSDSVASIQSHRLDQDPGEVPENGSWERGGAQPVDSQNQTFPSAQEDLRTRFYEKYHHEAEEYDREFIKKYDEDMNTTLIFAGLFSAVTSAFIIQAQPQLQPDTGEETTALLRVLIHKIDNTTFGGDVPTVPQWSGPPRAIVRVQAILYASLAVSLFSAFLAMLGKQWLNRYASIDMRGSAIERSQDRQRKLDGVATWYFDHVLESLPLMLQLALLLLGCALSLYLWEINTTVALVIIGVTSFGVGFYALIVIAGAASVSCPYQTPGARILRHVPLVLSALRPAFYSATIKFLAAWWDYVKQDRNLLATFIQSLIFAFLFPIILAFDAFFLAVGMVKVFVAVARRVRSVFRSARRQVPQTTVLDMRCMAWMLQTSLDEAIHLSILKLLASMTTLVDFDPALVSACFDVLAGCVSIVGGKAVIAQGSEELAVTSVTCCLRALSHPTIVDPVLGVFKDVQQRYTRTFPIATNFSCLPSYHRFCIIHNIFYRSWNWSNYHLETQVRPKIEWEDYKPTSTEFTVLTQFARFEYQTRQKVPRWILHIAGDTLSQDPLPHISVTINSLSIIAVDLDCVVPNTAALKESAKLEEVSSLITRKLENMAQVGDQDQIRSKIKTTTALFTYAVLREQYGEGGMIDAFLGVTRAAWLRTPTTGSRITKLFDRKSPDSLTEDIAFVSHCALWHPTISDTSMAIKWTAATLAVPYTEAVGRNVVNALLQFESLDPPYTPATVWALLKKRPVLPPICMGRSKGTMDCVVRRVRELGDIEILTLYFLLLWSEWNIIHPEGLANMRVSIREDFADIGMRQHREELIERLDQVLGKLEPGSEYLKHRSPWIDKDPQRTRGQYQELKEILLDVDREATEILTSTPS